MCTAGLCGRGQTEDLAGIQDEHRSGRHRRLKSALPRDAGLPSAEGRPHSSGPTSVSSYLCTRPGGADGGNVLASPELGKELPGPKEAEGVGGSGCEMGARACQSWPRTTEHPKNYQVKGSPPSLSQEAGLGDVTEVHTSDFWRRNRTEKSLPHLSGKEHALSTLNRKGAGQMCGAEESGGLEWPEACTAPGRGGCAWQESWAGPACGARCGSRAA